MTRMRLHTHRALTGKVETAARLRLELAGPWPRRLTATLDGEPAELERAGRVVALTVPAGEHRLELQER